MVIIIFWRVYETIILKTLPASLRDTNSIASFQRGLKTFLFRQEFENAL